MAIIHELSPHLADLIAAGEVVERPASVAKELIENAIDAGATRIQVEIEHGGISYLRIMDNGCGMSPEDAPVAFRRHATSKLRTEEDLTAIGTLGFRGEALAAIAAVSRIDLFTKQSGALAGFHLRLEAGQIQVQEEAGCPDGTTIIIRDLFFNTPARMKFLKKDFTEAGYVSGVVQHAALSHPEIAFSFLRDGKQAFVTAGDGKLITPVFGVFGREITANMIEADRFERAGIAAWGYLTKPHFCRPNRSMQHFFVNGRYIKSRLLQAALEEAYRNKIITGKYPSCALFLQLPLNQVDVNVHPAKTEVKFAQEKAVFEAVYIACKNTLEKHDNIPVMQPRAARSVKEDNLTTFQQQLPSSVPPVSPAQDLPQSEPAKPAPPASPKPTAPKFRPPLIEYDEDEQDEPYAPLAVHQTPEARTSPTYKTGVVPLSSLIPPPLFPKAEPKQQLSPESPVQAQPEDDQWAPSAQVIGEAFHTYLVAEQGESLILLDKHAAHERILFNQLRATTQVPQQQLLTPYIADLSASEFAALQENQDLVASAGFDISPFGENSLAVRAVPAYLDAADLPSVLAEMADKLASGRSPTPDRLDDLLHTVACKAAIKAGRQTSPAELQRLCNRVLSDPTVGSCPHGRPVTVRLTKYEIDKLFKRVNQ